MTRPTDVVAGAYGAHQRAVYAFTLNAVRDAELAADITQESFLRLLNEARRNRTPENVKAWLLRVAANLVADGGRSRMVAARWTRLFAGEPGFAESPEALALEREQREHIDQALSVVPHHARTGLMLAAHGFTGREIAAAIGKSEPATRTLLCRARRRLRLTFDGGRAGGSDSGGKISPRTGEPMDASRQGSRSDHLAAGLSGRSA